MSVPNSSLGFYFDRFRVLLNGLDFAGQPGNIKSLAVSRDGGLSWVDGMSQDHNPSGVLLANKHIIFKITENLQYNSEPIDFSAIDYSATSVDIILSAPNTQYVPQGGNVYENGSFYMLNTVAWANDAMSAHYGANVTRDLEFFVTGGDFWLPT